MAALAEDTEDADPPPRADSPGEVRKLTAFDCAGAGKLEELKRVAPDLGELQGTNLTREHLEVIQGMAKLRRLDAVGPQMWSDPFLVPPLAHDGGLEFLRVGLSALTAASLIYAHNRTLRHVQVLLPLHCRPSACFETLDYHLGGHVTEHILRSPWFPRREPGDFPVLERVEFIEEPRSSYVMNACWIVGKDIDRVERILPGVQLKHTCPLIPFDESEKDLEYMHLFF
ncbi:uncharacterized protein LOC113207044 [Frankliniella occidentalis]|uniref:Uncharacterized protein LOC113207044 n=1 Tax=Frankliniella occidentalis TaxID=133901 RepID=A0A9C6TTU9_FRAOC|nr:uncharacterized protein LOC113207044 [Frankliniella occidentalis]